MQSAYTAGSDRKSSRLPTPDGNPIAGGCSLKTLKIWDARPLAESK